jgi:hypothetical protein
MHMGPAGHQHMAITVLDLLGVPHDLEELPLTVHPEPGLRHHLAWVRDSAAPWVHRRVTGRSSGDGLDPRHASYVRLG